jgi:hypothetical protein
MGSSPRSFRIAALATGSVGFAAAVAFAGGASAAGPASFCRASVLEVSLAGTAFPSLAAAEGCAGEDTGVINPTTSLDPIPISLRVLYASTNPSAPNAEAGVADVTIDLSSGGGPVIGVQVLKSEASVTCSGTTPVLSGKSRVVGLTVDGEDQLVIPPGDAFTEIPADPLVNIKLNEQVKTATTITQNALHIHALTGALDLDVIVAQAQAGYTGDPCAPTTTGGTTGATTGGTTGSTTGATTGGSTGGSTGGGDIVGWMNGGGQLPGNVTHSLVLPCTKAQKHPGPNLTVQTPNGTFKLKTLSTVSCSLVAGNGDPEQPDAGFNTLTGTATGSCNGHNGVDASFTFTDGGEPNKGNDKATVTIDKDSKYGCHVSIEGATVNGNQQAHRGNNPPA